MTHRRQRRERTQPVAGSHGGCRRGWDPTVAQAAHDWDIAGAQAAGMRTVFLTRGHGHPLPGVPAPVVTASDLAEAVTAGLFR